MPIAPSTYFDHLAERADPALLSDRAKRDTLLLAEIKRMYKAHFEVYGAQQFRHQLYRKDFSVARCTVARLVRANGIEETFRGKTLRTSFSDEAPPCPRDPANRQCQAAAPNRLWVSDLIWRVWSYFPESQVIPLGLKMLTALRPSARW
ncbi:MAG: IS3 family transposase [Roseomonas sp.]|nr:IS3 family transposase [Roseomonas sp.]MCA3326397.1 IS3 family transposase [Roseomonas sp.]MCA3331536.1 IS3 family transposase [Roseomonas sp.]MCA3336421.1 IS3 family transposase [Roseomonas sp.]MCA3347853.1 IS3 family transposase [Roseomonas sp.]